MSDVSDPAVVLRELAAMMDADSSLGVPPWQYPICRVVSHSDGWYSRWYSQETAAAMTARSLRLRNAETVLT